jgi:hypothetical protein
MAASQTLRTLKLSLLADVSQFGSQLDKAGGSFDKFSNNVAAASKVATGVIGALGGIAVSAINAASDLSETSSAVEAVFGPKSARQLQEFARGASRALGQSRQDALAAAQNFGIFGQSAGLADEELVDFTTNLVSLASDLASFNNTSVDQAINALGAALRGESEPIRTYGVLLDAATLQARAFADGLIEAENEALTPQLRTLAAYNEILAQTTLQQGDFERTSEGLANSQRILKAELENFRVELGEELLPVVQLLLPEVRGLFDTILSVEPSRLIEIGEAIGKIAIAIVSLNAALKVFATVQGAWRAIAAFAAAVAGGSVGASAAVAGGVVVGGAVAAEAFSESLTPEERSRIGSILSGGRAATVPVPQDFSGSAGRRGRGNVTVNVTGIVGSGYQVQREIERALANADRVRAAEQLGLN